MKFLKRVKEIRSRTGELHFERYAIIETVVFGLYIHTIYKADQDLHLHSHPWNFFTIVLKGIYIAMNTNSLSIKGPGALSHMRREDFHKIDQIILGPVKTLFVTWGRRKPWYYQVGTDKVESGLYRKMKHTTGFKNDQNAL